MDAIIDVGSNSVRLMFTSNKPVCKKATNSTRLADGLSFSGSLSDDAMDRTEKAIVEFVREAKEKNAENIYIFATEAVRSAKNGKEFALRIEKATGIKVDIVSGETEAKLGLLGAIDSFSGEITVIDIGGASVEIVKGDENRVYYAKSAPLGAVRLQNTLSGEENIEKFVRSALPVYGIVSGNEGVVIGGTATSLASMDLRQKVYDETQTHGHVLTLSALRSLKKEIFASADLQKDFPTLSLNRAKVIGHGIITLICIMEYLGLDYVTVSERDNCEGYYKYIKTV